MPSAPAPERRGAAEFRQRFGPWALVAGASEGLGAAFAESLARRGLHLQLVARREAPLRATAERLRRAHGVEVQPICCDLGRPDLLTALEPAIGARDLGLLVYNAALAPLGSFLDGSLEEHQATLQVNCRAPLILAHHLGRRMLARGRGGILLMSSMSGLQGTALAAHYAATRAYNLILAEGMWEELRSQGVAVLACCAGPTRTPGYQASRPARLPLAPPVMTPELVVEEALQRLGRQPSMIPGRFNRSAAALISRLLPRRWAVQLYGHTMKAMYGGAPRG